MCLLRAALCCPPAPSPYFCPQTLCSHDSRECSRSTMSLSRELMLFTAARTCCVFDALYLNCDVARCSSPAEALCSISGYVNSLRPAWLRLILRWQHVDGCWGLPTDQRQERAAAKRSHINQSASGTHGRCVIIARTCCDAIMLTCSVYSTRHLLCIKIACVSMEF